MPRVLVYYAHPGHKNSRVNKTLSVVAQENQQVTFIDLYAEYPRYEINVDAEQERLKNHDVILFQHPLFWYSTPALIKEWVDLVLEDGFAFGEGGDKLAGKLIMNITSASGSEESYTSSDPEKFSLRTLLSPLEQTARLCRMKYISPYVLFSALKARAEVEIYRHAQGYRDLLRALCNGTFDIHKASGTQVITSQTVGDFLGGEA